MTILTATSTLAIGDATVISESTTITVIPAAGAFGGAGRLVHPTLGTYDYMTAPDEWMNLDGDAIIPPVWATTKTLRGAANTVFAGDLRDVIVEERWVQNVSCRIEHVRALLGMWMNPPDPSTAYIEWYPQYWSAHGFNVVLLGLTLGNREITLTSLAHQGYVRGPLVLRMRIASRKLGT